MVLWEAVEVLDIHISAVLLLILRQGVCTIRLLNTVSDLIDTYLTVPYII